MTFPAAQAALAGAVASEYLRLFRNKCQARLL